MKLPRIFLLLLILLLIFTPIVLAQQGTWQFNAEVTEVGKNAERARQLIFWIFTHPPSYNVAVFSQIWGISRNIVYALFILVLALIGLGFILAKRNGTIGPIFNGISSPLFGLTIPTLFYRVIILLIYVTFSYIIVLGLIQSSEIISRFFIEQFQGCRLFNITFTGTSPDFDCKLVNGPGPDDPTVSKEIESNYLEFVGYRDPNALSAESANTGLFLVRITTLTYNIMAIAMILRQVILWFLLMLSPFLAILLPFMFIRNTGYIWIGVFFQWLFYGPLVALFIGGLANVWESGIPYAFNFSRVNTADGQVFPTAINILYGGPAQTLSPTNSANYIDTYAEYIIALVMLWTAIFLPWLLLRIFRDYCCDILKQNNAAILSAFDRLKGPPAPKTPPQPTGPSSPIQLPFRQPVSELKKTTIDRLRDVSRSNTQEITRELSLSVSSLTQIARYDMNKIERTQVVETLNRIANPFIVSRPQDRQTFINLKKELETRALAGDKQAALVLSAAEKKFNIPSLVSFVSETPQISKEEIINSISRNTDISREKVQEVLAQIPTINVNNQVNVVAQVANISNDKAQNLIQTLPEHAPTGVTVEAMLAENPQLPITIAQRTGLSEEKVREVLQVYSNSTLTTTERIEKIAKETTNSSEKVKEVINSLPEAIVANTPEFYQQAAQSENLVAKVAQSTLLTKEKVVEVLNKVAEESIKQSTTIISKESLLKEEFIKDIATKTNQSETTVRNIITAITQSKQQLTSETIQNTAKNENEVTNISQKTNTAPQVVKDVLNKASEVKETSTTEEIISRVAKSTSQSESTIKNVLQTTTQLIPGYAPEMLSRVAQNRLVISLLAKSTQLPETSITDILERTSKLSTDKVKFEDKVDEVSKRSEVSKESVKDVLSTMSAFNLEKPEAVKAAKAPKRTAVTVEDYEEVKNMWMNHYKLTEVPKTESIKTREQWLDEDIRFLTNTINLISSLNPKDKQMGLKQVAAILPFLMLGGFSEAETTIYLKAKLQAAKSVLASLEEREKLKEEVKKEEEETLVEIKEGERQEEEKTMTTEQTQELPLPEEENKNQTQTINKPQEPVK
ncbi:hypothetical protein HYT02_06015 [Candidatus Gottesmanbacteria bacterium]|nr:hypothetical protein [Candidatus Gottesmanbacteria bacterium]